MPKRNKRPNPAKAGSCDLCGLSGKSIIPGAKHRRCGGSAGRPPQPKHGPNLGARGYWR